MAWNLVGTGALDGAANVRRCANRTSVDALAARKRRPGQPSPGSIASNSLAFGPLQEVAGRYHKSGRSRLRPGLTASSFRPGEP